MKVLASVVTEVDRFTLVENDDGSLYVPQSQTEDPIKFFAIAAYTRLMDVAKAKNRYENIDMKIMIEQTERVFKVSLFDEKSVVVFSAEVTLHEDSNLRLKEFFRRLPELFGKTKNFA